MPRGHVNQEVANFPAGHRLEVFDDRVNMPAWYKRRRRLDDRPSQPDEIFEPPPC
jgi:hypothetical protein